MVAKTLTYSQNTVPVHLMNISDEMCSIYPGTNIANACSVAEVQSVKTKANTSQSAVPSHLADLYQRTVEGMNGSQQKQVAHLLNKYSSVFSETDDDIGRTGDLRHKNLQLMHGLSNSYLEGFHTICKKRWKSK